MGVLRATFVLCIVILVCSSGSQSVKCFSVSCSFSIKVGYELDCGFFFILLSGQQGAKKNPENLTREWRGRFPLTRRNGKIKIQKVILKVFVDFFMVAWIVSELWQEWDSWHLS